MNHQLRVWTPEDIPSLTFHINNINIWNNTRDGLPHPYTEEDAENFIKMNMEHEGPAENFAIDIDGDVEEYYVELPPQPTRLAYKLAVAEEIYEELIKRLD